jgi:hypothetical protein
MNKTNCWNSLQTRVQRKTCTLSENLNSLPPHIHRPSPQLGPRCFHSVRKGPADPGRGQHIHRPVAHVHHVTYAVQTLDVDRSGSISFQEAADGLRKVQLQNPSQASLIYRDLTMTPP